MTNDKRPACLAVVISTCLVVVGLIVVVIASQLSTESGQASDLPGLGGDSGSDILMALPAIQSMQNLATPPRDLEHADAKVARWLTDTKAHIRAARSSGNARHLLYAHDLLAKISATNDAGIVGTSIDHSAAVHLLRATLLQAEHQFDPALGEIQHVLAIAPDDQEAILLKASIERVQGRYDTALASCKQLNAVGGRITALICEEEIASLTGDDGAYDRLRRTILVPLQRAQFSAGLAHWAHLVLATMANRHGDLHHAQRHFLSALSSEPTVYAISSYAQWLVTNNRAAEAIKVLRAFGATQSDAAEVLQVDLAIALSTNGDQSAAREISIALEKQWAFSDIAGRSVHYRERARAALYLFENPLAAADFAARNWREQREPDDLVILMQSAIAARDQALLNQAREFLNTTNYRDSWVETQLKTGFR